MHLSSEEQFELELRSDILKTIAYFDLFRYPLSAEQIYAFLPRNSVTADRVAGAARSLVTEQKLSHHDGLYHLPSEHSLLVRERRHGERRAVRMLIAARFVARFIKLFPYVRGIFLTGSLSKNVAESTGDIDFMIVTEPGRLWICRTLLTLFRKIVLFGNSKFFCTNYYVTQNGMTVGSRNLYAAVEVVTTKALWNADAFRDYQNKNSWTKQFLPNTSAAADEHLLISARRSVVQRALEFIIELFPLGPVDERLMEYHRAHWQKAYGSASDERSQSMFIISRDVSASWPEDRQQPVLTHFRDKISQLGLR